MQRNGNCDCGSIFEADKDSLHTQLADEAVCIGPAPSKDSYLNMERIISAAMVTGADAVHPGFGFLSENARFAEVCEKCGLTFVGPSSNVIRALGNKQIARNTMVSAGIPVIPGTDHPILEVEEGEKEADRIGYPVIVKAALGGGGKGMRTAWTREEFSQAFLTAKKRRNPPLATAQCISNILWSIPDTLNFRSWQTAREM